MLVILEVVVLNVVIILLVGIVLVSFLLFNVDFLLLLMVVVKFMELVVLIL